MSVELIEIIKQQIAALSPQEKSELLRYLQEQARQDAPPSAPSPDDAAAESMRQRRTQWLKAHQEEFGGQYVALDGDRLVGTGRTYPEAATAAKRAGVTNAFVTYVYPCGYVGEIGGWQ